jgi:hypothetical protein
MIFNQSFYAIFVWVSHVAFLVLSIRLFQLLTASFFTHKKEIPHGISGL